MPESQVKFIVFFGHRIGDSLVGQDKCQLVKSDSTKKRKKGKTTASRNIEDDCVRKASSRSKLEGLKLKR